ncbi:DsbA family protein [Sulfurospirillum arcachonense]|uniref:DsbA family protein n=1 Tax=Sulfurospirillum arcachonense TaxID=57666 RepID=UPI00046A42C8|nr:histidine kinase [Sulfurospirillum arcachonense]
MTKQLIMITSVLSTSLFGATDAQIITYFESKIPVPTVKVDISSRVSIANIKDMDYVSLNISDGTRVQKLSVFTQGDLIFPDVISVKEGSIKDKLDKQKLIRELSILYKQEDKNNIITLGDDPQKETLVKFTDPECPFCYKEIQKIETKLQTYNLKLIFTPVHDRSSLEKSVLIYRQTSKAKDLGKKLQIIKKYFNSDVDEKVSDEEVQNIENLIKKYFAAGLEGVPFYVNEKELLQ